MNNTPKLLKNDDASAGGIAGLALNFVFFSFICIILGKVMDILVRTSNSFIGKFVMSADAVNTMSTLVIIFYILPIIYLVFLVINHLLIGKKETTGEV
jgi:hypothetical protein